MVLAARVVVASAALQSLVRQCFERVGLCADDAGRIAEALVDANLRGNDSHGVARAPAYLRRAASGSAKGSEAIREVVSAGPLRRIDAGGALGPLAASSASRLVSELAADHGIGLVAVGNSSHFGSAGFYARRIAGGGLIALVATNGPAGMAPYGSTKAFLGTNAFAVAAPLPAGEQFVLDMSCSVAARGKVIRARALGDPIEPGLAVAPDGSPTTDAAEALAGAVLPLGGPKGTGLAFAISLAAAVLAGASFDCEAAPIHDPNGPPQGLGQLFLGIDPWRLADREEAEGRIAELIERLHSLPPAPGFERVLYSGERGELERRRRLDGGLPIASVDLEELAGVCDELDHRDLAAQARELLAVET